MNTYVGTFPGHYLGGVAVVQANNMESAAALIFKEARKSGLRNPAIKVELMDLSEPGIVYFNDGDY